MEQTVKGALHALLGLVVGTWSLGEVKLGYLIISAITTCMYYAICRI